MDVAHLFGGGVYVKETRIPAGYVLVQHKHAYDHLSYLVSGSVEVLVDGVRSVLTGPAGLTVKANKHHGVKSLTDAVWLCIHATDCSDADEVDSVLVVPGDEQQEEIAEALQ